jgi:hypothetical protein
MRQNEWRRSALGLGEAVRGGRGRKRRMKTRNRRKKKTCKLLKDQREFGPSQAAAAAAAAAAGTAGSLYSDSPAHLRNNPRDRPRIVEMADDYSEFRETNSL